VALIPDIGPLLAALDAADPDHARCAALLTESVEALVVPALVLADPAPAPPAEVPGETYEAAPEGAASLLSR